MMTVFLFIGLWHLHFENKKRVSFYYRNHRLPTKEILLKYDIRGLSQLRNWVILYNNGKEPVRKAGEEDGDERSRMTRKSKSLNGS
jgi:hypothetical protein